MKQQAISNFKDYLSRSTKIPTDKFEELVCLLDYIELDKNQKLISSGKICDKMYFLADGLIKYEISQFNEQKLVHIATKGAFVADFFSYFSSQPAITNVYTIIPSQFLSAPKCALEDLYANCTIWSNFGRLIAENAVVNQIMQRIELQTLSPEERYLKILSTQPEILNWVKLGDLAQCLGITQETLSRIRRRI